MAPTMADGRMKAANKLGRCHCGDRPTTAMVRQRPSTSRRVLMVSGVRLMRSSVRKRGPPCGAGHAHVMRRGQDSASMPAMRSRNNLCGGPRCVWCVRGLHCERPETERLHWPHFFCPDARPGNTGVNANAAQCAALAGGRRPGATAKERAACAAAGQNLCTRPRPKVLEPVVPLTTLPALFRPP